MKAKRVIESIGVYTEDGSTRLGGVTLWEWMPEGQQHQALFMVGDQMKTVHCASFDEAADLIVSKHEEATNV